MPNAIFKQIKLLVVLEKAWWPYSTPTIYGNRTGLPTYVWKREFKHRVKTVQHAFVIISFLIIVLSILKHHTVWRVQKYRACICIYAWRSGTSPRGRTFRSHHVIVHRTQLNNCSHTFLKIEKDFPIMRLKLWIIDARATILILRTTIERTILRSVEAKLSRICCCYSSRMIKNLINARSFGH